MFRAISVSFPLSFPLLVDCPDGAFSVCMAVAHSVMGFILPFGLIFVFCLNPNDVTVFGDALNKTSGSVSTF